MFSFHKPKVYRSTAGCCICKAKSSSSRFTDSKKYETDFIQCFQLENPRRGEICNACVLLVKRFKRLPPGSNRHWGHVVDARTGPGLKSMTKFKKRKEEQEVKDDKDRYNKIFKKSKKKFKKETSSLGGSSDDSPPSPTESQHSDDYDDGIFQKKFFGYTTRAQQSLKRKEAEQKAAKRKRKNPHPIKVSRWPANYFNLFSDVVNDELWRPKSTCCGSVYECKELQAFIVNAASFKPCQQHQGKESKGAMAAPVQHTTAIKKHQLFLKRHIEPSSVTRPTIISDISSSCSSSIATELSNICDKTEPIDTSDDRKGQLEGAHQLIDIKFKTIHLDVKKSCSVKPDSIQNTFEKSSELKDKLLQEVMMTHQESIKSIKSTSPPQISNPLASVNGDKISMLKYKLANIARFGVIGNDNSSDSGYEEVVQDGGNKLISMPPPSADVML